jgi:hypothetical protein
VKKNRFSKALKHLKSTELDDKIQRLNEGPTNSIDGVYALNPSGFKLGPLGSAKVFYPDVDGNWPAGIPGTPGELSYIRPPGHYDGEKDWDSIVSTDFSQDYLLNDPTGTSTAGLIAADGTVLSQLPPGGQGFILGPLVDGYVRNHGYDDYTNIGYLQKDTRQFVLLARIQGHWSTSITPSGFTPNSAWDGTSGQLTIYNQNFTLAMAEWFRDQVIVSNNFTTNVPYFYSGGVPQIPQSAADCPNCPPGMYGGNAPGSKSFGQGGNPNIGNRQNPNHGGPKDAGYPWGLLGSLSDKLKGLVKGLGNFFEPLSSLAFAGATFGSFLLQQQGLVDYTKSNPYQATLPPQDAKEISQSLNNVVNTIPRERWENLNGNDLQKINNVLNPGTGPTPSNPDRKVGDQKNTDEYHLIVNNIGRSDAFKGNIKIDPITKKEYVSQINDNYVFTNDSDASVKGAPELINFFATSFGAQNRPDMQQSKDIYARTDQLDTSDPDATKWKIGEEIKLKNMPISVPLPAPSGGTEYKYNPAGGGMGGKRGGAVKEAFVLSEDHRRILREIKQPVAVKEQPRTQKLEKYRPNFAGKYTSQNTPDVTACPQSDEMVKAKNAAGQTWRLKDRHWSRYESTERMNIIFDNVGHGSQYWDMIINENQNKKGIRDRAVQEHLNMIAHNRAMLSEDPTYQSPFRNNIEEQETIQADQDPLFKKVAKRLKPAIDYPNKPSPNGFPTEPPPEMIDGWHPEYGNKSNYYNTLDPHSANSMPTTGNAEIDAKVRRAKTLKRVLGKRA